MGFLKKNVIPIFIDYNDEFSLVRRILYMSKLELPSEPDDIQYVEKTGRTVAFSHIKVNRSTLIRVALPRDTYAEAANAYAAFYNFVQYGQD